MRGMDSLDATISSGLGHATSFLGSDSLPVIHGARKYYDEKDFVVGSVNATEHSVMCAGTKGDEIGTFRYLMNQFPTGILSIVSDTWDLWKVLTVFLPQLKDEILARDGKIVIRPDSGDPVSIICGENSWYDDEMTYEEREENPLKWQLQHGGKNKPTKDSYKGVIELLWDIFGGTINDQGYKVLDPHIGAIYGDSITIDRAEEICKRLEAKGFASTNIVLGIGSFTYQYNTRDTFGFAMKATYCEIEMSGYPEGRSPEALEPSQWTEKREIFKDPITDDGTKKSAKGLLTVIKLAEDGHKDYVLIDQVDWDKEDTGYLQTIFEDGKFYNETTLMEIRDRLK
jgi:nicotinamide phosphoribosyltransferase